MLNLAFSPKKVECPFIALFWGFRPTVKLPIPTVAPPNFIYGKHSFNLTRRKQIIIAPVAFLMAS